MIGASSWFFTNAEELAALGGDVDEPHAFRARHGLAGLCVKFGPGGATVFTDEVEVSVPALHTHPVVDTTGAGDALAAGFLARRLTAPGEGLRDALAYGVACASITIEEVGLRALRRANRDTLVARVTELARE